MSGLRQDHSAWLDPDSKNRNYTVSCSLTQREFDELEKQRQEIGESRSEVIRAAIFQFLSKRKVSN